MPITTSSQFASVIETGTDWRDTSKKVLEQLESIRTDNQNFNIGFLYVSDHLADDLTSIVNLFKSVLEIESWVGSIGMGVCGNGAEEIDTVSISVMVGHLDQDQFHFYAPLLEGSNKQTESLQKWLTTRDPMLVITHADPMMQDNPVDILEHIDNKVGGFTVGGLASSRKDHLIIGQSDAPSSTSCLILSSNIPVATSLSQGCDKICEPHVVTRSDKNKVYEIDGKPALDVFEEDIRRITIKKAGIDPEHMALEKDESGIGRIPEEYQDLLKGEIHAAFPISGSDQGNYLVRHITGIDDEEKSMEISYHLKDGEHILFVHRDDDTVQSDLSKQILCLRERVLKDYGVFAPKGALYFSCVARAFTNFGKGQSGGEMELIHNIIGDVPLAGFYASGEINAGQLYGYTGILVLFL